MQLLRAFFEQSQIFFYHAHMQIGNKQGKQTILAVFLKQFCLLVLFMRWGLQLHY